MLERKVKAVKNFTRHHAEESERDDEEASDIIHSIKKDSLFK
ncbi:hypothetical protein [Vagococcus lutrae]|nr:hypothetical protein [Vagococcus lutrae]